LTPEIEEQLAQLHRSGLTAKEALARVAAGGLSRKELYRAWLKIAGA
jgi:hypothetical protein